ncbi:MAG TPA: KH domain-containing protein [Candidatus Dojkabacteria bacterium]|nr:KH domain-containing protein [Candidatus Dojkabacteria bacterium]
MLELLNYILINIIKDPETVKINKEENGQDVVLNVTVPKEERGVVIGKIGRNINAIRNLVSIIARRENKKVFIRIVD